MPGSTTNTPVVAEIVTTALSHEFRLQNEVPVQLGFDPEQPNIVTFTFLDGQVRPFPLPLLVAAAGGGEATLMNCRSASVNWLGMDRAIVVQFNVRGDGQRLKVPLEPTNHFLAEVARVRGG